ADAAGASGKGIESVESVGHDGVTREKMDWEMAKGRILPEACRAQTGLMRLTGECRTPPAA
ncbi:MAG TPA: hypothetical protein VF501_03945, partial [Thiobacillus sp.]